MTPADTIRLREILDVTAYHPDAVAKSQGPIEGLTAQLLIVRAAAAVAEEDMPQAEDALCRAIALGLVGYAATQAQSALRVIRGEPDPPMAEPRQVIAKDFGILTNFAPHLWSASWDGAITVLLDLPDHLPDDPASPACAQTLADAAAQVRRFIDLVPPLIARAIAGNAEYLDAPDPAAYRLSTISLGIGECTIAADGQADITMTFDDELSYIGAFLSH
jgi:hypothetical protein